MSCSRIRSELFYLAEDDAMARNELETHLEACSNCRNEWQQYQALLGVHESGPFEPAPGFHPRIKFESAWRTFRAAAVLVLLTLIGSILPQHIHRDAKTRQAASNPAAHSWELPTIPTQNLIIDSRDLDFSVRIESLRISIARLQSQTTSNKF